MNKQYIEAAVSIHALLINADEESPSQKSPPDIPQIGVRIGSRLVPRKDVLRQYFSELCESFRPQLDAHAYDATAWNRLTLFVYRLCQLCTGIRPVRDAVPTWEAISLRLGWMRIEDKDNLHFRESRFVPMAAKLRAWVEYLGHVQPSAFIFLHLPAGLTDSHGTRPYKEMLVVADTDMGALRPFDLDDIDMIEQNIPFSQPFSFKANALRHHLMTRLLEADIDQSVIDAIMGHKHYGKEPIGRFSMMHPKHFARRAAAAIEAHIVDPLEIPDPPGALP